MRRSLLIVLLSIALPATAQIYKYTDANGNTAYSSQPPEGRSSQTVELPPLNSVESQPRGSTPPSPSPAPASTPAAPTSSYRTLQLTDLPSEEALRANNGTFTVGVTVEPRLARGHAFQLVLDGAPYGQPSNVPRLQLTEVDRGEHSMAVQVVDANGTVLQQSETVTVAVQRVHL